MRRWEGVLGSDFLELQSSKGVLGSLGFLNFGFALLRMWAPGPGFGLGVQGFWGSWDLCGAWRSKESRVDADLPS